ncbi:VapE domain-containing protein [Lacticaseibacillus saniviri]
MSVKTDLPEATQGEIIKFKDIVATAGNWTKKLRLSQNTDLPKVSDVTNAELILMNDERLADHLAYNLFSNKVELVKPLKDYPLSKTDTNNADAISVALQSLISRYYGATFGDKVLNNAIITAARANAYNPVLDRLQLGANKWKEAGRPNLVDTLFIDYLGVADTPLNRQKTRMALAGLAARAAHPGIKFDFMTILFGPQGSGKTTLLRQLGGDYYTEALTSLDDKDSLMNAMQSWLVNDDELTVISGTRFAIAKKFITAVKDAIRFPYAKSVTTKPRTATIFGTTNQRDMLKDKTGSRRFIVIECNATIPKKSVMPTSTDKGFTEEMALLVLGEAYTRLMEDGKDWRALYWDDDELAQVANDNENFEADDPVAEQVKQYLDMPLPADWNTLSWEERRMYIHTEFNEGDDRRRTGVKPRDTVSTTAILLPLFGFKREDAGTAQYKSMASHVRMIMDNLPNWRYEAKGMRVDGEATHGWRRVAM